MKKNLLLILFVAFIAQSNMNLFGQMLTPSLIHNNPKALFTNPALFPDKGSFLSLPVVGSLNAGISNGFSFNDIMEKRGNAYYLQATKLLETAADNSNFLTANYNLDILHVGLNINERNHLSLSIRNRSSIGGQLPVGLIEFALDNPLDKVAIFDMNFDFNATIWNEIGVAFTHNLDSNWNFGARIKLLTGLANGVAENSTYSLKKLDNGNYLLSSNVDIKTASFFGGKVDIDSWFGNPGMAVDLGAQYKADNKRWSVNAGVSDLGKIFWSKAGGARTATLYPNKQMEFSGFGDLEATLNGDDFSLEDKFDSVWTNFKDTAGIVTTKDYSYSTALPLTFQIFGTYAIDEGLSHNVSVGFEGRNLSSEIFYYGISGSYYWLSPQRMWQLMASYTHYSNSANGIGISAAFNTAGFQVYLGIDNVMLPSFLGAKYAGIDFGLSWFW